MRRSRVSMAAAAVGAAALLAACAYSGSGAGAEQPDEFLHHQHQSWQGRLTSAVSPAPTGIARRWPRPRAPAAAPGVRT